MATPKDLTAHDVVLDRLFIKRQGTAIIYERRYWYADIAGAIIEDLPSRRLSGTVEWATIPPDIQTALQTIDTWTYNQILAQEGMT
jgi:hypothetical protein